MFGFHSNILKANGGTEKPKAVNRFPGMAGGIEPVGSEIAAMPNTGFVSDGNAVRISDIGGSLLKNDLMRKRRTDEQAKNQPLMWPRKSASTVDAHHALLRNAAAFVNVSGVYILRLNGQVMKVGSAEIGVQKRMQQYYGLNKSCGLNEINAENRDQIWVTWQDCPKSKCNELESKLAKKYGLGPWAKRTPHSAEDTWDLLI